MAYRTFDLEPLEPRRLLSAAMTSAVNAALSDVEPWVQQAELTVPNGRDGKNFGRNVAIDGNTMVVSVPQGDDNQGAAYVFTETASRWTEIAELTASDGNPYQYFGDSVAISGNTVVVGSLGTAYVFTEPATGWADVRQTARLTCADVDGFDNGCFGTTVAISGDTIVVGASNADVGQNSGQGAVYVFAEPSSGWQDMTPTARLTSSDGTEWGWFGGAIAIDGNKLVIGADNTAINGHTCPGAAYVFTEPDTGWTDMTQTAEFTPSDSGDFGDSVAISGNTVVVGEFLSGESFTGDYEGAAYVFTDSPTGWTQAAELTTSDTGASVGASVAISGDTVLATASFDWGARSAVYQFTEPDSGWVNTTNATKIIACNDGKIDYSASSIAVGGNTIAIGSQSATVDGSNQGVVYVFVPGAAAVPTVSNLSAASGAAGGGGTVIITGVNLLDADAVHFGNSPAVWLAVISDTQIAAMSPAGAVGTVDVTVSTPGGTSATSAADQYTYAPRFGPTGTGVTLTQIAGSSNADWLGTFDPGSAANAQLFAVVDWGDGSAPNDSDDAYVGNNGGEAPYEVLDGHTYSEPGIYQVHIAVLSGVYSQNGDPAAVIAQWDSTIYANAPTLVEIAGQQFAENLGSFDTACPAGCQLIALIDWGDGTPVTDGAIVNNDTGSAGQYAVTGTHAYATIGNYQIHITVGYVPQGTARRNLARELVALDQWEATANVPGVTITEVAGQPFTTPLGTIGSWNIGLGASIDWGDGTSGTSATLMPGSSPNLGFTVIGTHTYAAPGTYDIRVYASDMITDYPGCMMCFEHWESDSVAIVLDQAPVDTGLINTPPGSANSAAATRRTSPFADGVPITAANSGSATATLLAPNRNANGDLNLLADWTDGGVWQRLD